MLVKIFFPSKVFFWGHLRGVSLAAIMANHSLADFATILTVYTNIFAANLC
jgi:phage tail protein X